MPVLFPVDARLGIEIGFSFFMGTCDILTGIEVVLGFGGEGSNFSKDSSPSELIDPELL